MSRQPRRPRFAPRPSACLVEPLEGRRLLSAVIAVAGRDALLVFDSASPEKAIAKLRVRGLRPNESLAGIDFRPATGQLYGLGDSSRLYRIDPTTGRATAVGAFAPSLSGTEFGFDFDPAADRARVVSDADLNARINPDTGLVEDANPGVAGTQTDLPLAYAAGDVAFAANPTVVASAYTNSVAGGSPATLYGIDSDTNMLVRQGGVGGSPDSPDGGKLVTVGALGVDAGAVAGLDVATTGGADTAYAALATADGGPSGFYTVNLSTGSATLVGQIRGSKAPVRDIAVVPRGRTVLVLDGKNRLTTFDSNLPNVPLSRARVTGLARREKLVAVDVRPADNVVYAFSNQNRLYTLNAATGAAAAVGEPAAVTPRKSPAGIDFDPVADRVRLVNAAGQNLRLNPANGQAVDADGVMSGTQIDGPLVFASTDPNADARPAVTGIAHGGNAAGATSTTLYAIDARLNVLATIGSVGGSTSPNAGQMFTVGPLGVDVRDAAPTDIVTAGGADTAYAAFRPRQGGFGLYRIDLATGSADGMGLLPKGVVPVGLTVLPAQ